MLLDESRGKLDNRGGYQALVFTSALQQASPPAAGFSVL
jgi:hypothetical protein